MIERTWIRHDYTTLAPGMISDRLTAFAMDPVVRENIFARTRAIIRANLPHLESWVHANRGTCSPMCDRSRARSDT